MTALLLSFGQLSAQETDCPCSEPGSIVIGDPTNTDNPNSSVTSLTASPLGGLPSTTLTGGCVNVYGKLIVNVDFTFDNCVLIMEPGASIEVMTSRELIIQNGSVLQGCDFMWRGIHVKSSGRLLMSSSTLQDAQYALLLENSANIRLVDNTFDANYVGIYTKPLTLPTFGNYSIITNGVNGFKDNSFVNESIYLPPYNGQSPNPGSVPYAGIFLNKVNWFQIGSAANGNTQNTFKGLRHGIIDINGASNQYSGCNFINMDYDYPAGVGVLLLDAQQTKIIHSIFEEVRVGIEVNTFRNLTISNNEITQADLDPTSVYNAAIRMTLGTQTSSVNNNTISGLRGIQLAITSSNSVLNMKGNTFQTNIGGIYAGNVAGELNITNNGFLLQSTAQGLSLYQNSGKTFVKDNVLEFSESEEDNCAQGLFMYLSMNGQIVENKFESESGYTTNCFSEAIGVWDSQNFLYCCNSMDGTGNGVMFGGLCSDTKLAGTSFGRHLTALNYQVAITSPQINHGNDWSQANAAWYDALYYGDLSNLAFSLYMVEPSLLPNGLAQIDPSSWFILSGNDPTCEEWTDETEYCGETPLSLVEDPGEFASLTTTDLYALLPLQGIDTIDLVLKWNAQRYLYSKLANNPSLITWNGAVDTFYTEAQTGLVGQLHAIEKGIQGLSAMPTGLELTYEDALEALNDHYSEIYHLASYISTAPDNELDSLNSLMDDLFADLVPLMEDYEDAETAIADWRTDQIDDLITNNALITPVTAFQEYEQTAYELYLSTVAVRADTLTTAQKSTLEGIAIRCPLIDGTGVYWARTILTLYDQAPVWNWDECDYLEDRSPAVKFKFHESPAHATLYPNPTNGHLNLILESALTKDGVIRVYSMDGVLMMQDKMSIGADNHHLNVSSLPKGMFLLELRQEGSIVFSNRFVVTH